MITAQNRSVRCAKPPCIVNQMLKQRTVVCANKRCCQLVQSLVCFPKCVSVCHPLLRQGFLEGPKQSPSLSCPWSYKESSAIQRHRRGLPQPTATSTQVFNLSPHTQVSYCDSIREREAVGNSSPDTSVPLLNLFAKLP